MVDGVRTIDTSEKVVVELFDENPIQVVQSDPTFLSFAAEPRCHSQTHHTVNVAIALSPSAH